ncbi:MAG: hypothetical protein Tsb002_27450 [Wenzhouxiangellaceae bacterium]
MDRQEALAFIERYTEEVWNQKNYEQAETFFSDDFIDHDPLPTQGEGRSGFLTMVKMVHAAYPQMKVENTGLYFDAEEETVIARWSATGSHGDNLLGMLISKKPVKMKGVDIFRLQQGKISERWGEFDSLGLFS